VKEMEIDAKGMYFRDLNAQIREAIANGETEIILNNINGQRYIGDNLGGDTKIIINGVPGQDLAFCMNGPSIVVNANAQDGVGNTMSKGKIVIHGNAGDICGYAMRGGKIFIKGNVGYRSGIHMKEYKDTFPTIVVGGCAGDFFGEYMAGGIIVVLGIDAGERDLVGNFCATGMHGGKMFLRGKVPDYKLAQEVKVVPLDENDTNLLSALLQEYSADLGLDINFDPAEFIQLMPGSVRPYGRLYAY
jgi:glutamate synthase domain-containing protein 3